MGFWTGLGWGWNLPLPWLPELATKEEEEAAIKAAEEEALGNVKPPTPYVEDGDDIKINLVNLDNFDDAPEPPTKPKEVIEYNLGDDPQSGVNPPQPVVASLPNWWQWGPVAWFAGAFIREKPQPYKKTPNVDPDSGPNTFTFGRLLCDNHFASDLTAWEWTEVVPKEELQITHQESYDAFVWWLTRQAKGAPIPIQKGDFWDQGLLLWPLDIKNMGDGIVFMYGTETIGNFFTNWWLRSGNFSAGSFRGVTYENVLVNKQAAPWVKTYRQAGEEVDSESGGDGTNIGLAQSIANVMGNTEAQPRIVLQNSGPNKIAKVLGEDQFPFEVPISLLLEQEDIKDKDPEWIRQNAMEEIKSLPQLMLWLTKALDELIGKFPIAMEVTESDLLDLNDEYAAWKANKPAEPSDLPWYLQNDKLVNYREEDGRIIKTVKVPNLAEAVAEMLGAGMIDRQMNNLSVELLSRIINELGSTKGLTVNANAWIEAVADYLGFASKDKLIEVEYTYNPLIEVEDNKPWSWQQFLKPTTVKTPLPEFVETLTFEAKFQLIKEIHGIVKAGLTEGIGKDDSQMLKRLKDYAKELGVSIPSEENDGGDNAESTEKDDFDLFIEQVEAGFIDKGAWASESTPQPYGREFNQRPKIKRLGNTAPDANP